MAQYILAEGAAPSTPASGFATIYAKTDGKVYSKDDAGTEYDLTASGGGTHNLLDGSTHPDTLAGTVTAGDLIIGNATPKWARLALGAANKVLGIVAGLPAWVDSLQSLMTAKGDLVAASAANTPARLAVGSNGQKIKANSAQSTGLEWVDDTVSISFIIDGGGSAITTGQKGHLEIPFACTITGWTILADQSGSIVVDVWKDTYANFPPTVADTIAGSEKPTLSSVQKNQDLALTTWTTAVAAGDILAFNVDSATTVTRVLISIRATRT